MDRRQMILRTAAAGALCLSVGMISSARADTWDMPVPYGQNNFHTVNHIQFAKDVEAATSGKIKIKVHSSGSLFKHPEIKNAVRSGQVPIGEFLLSRLSNENPIFQIDSIPFLASGYDDAKKLWDASRPKVNALLDKQGLMVLYAVPWPPQGLYAKREVKSSADLKGVKFRAYNAALERLAQLAGAVPTQIEVPDIPQAFSTGRVDAMITSPSTGANTKAWDYLTHFHHIQGWLPKNLVVVNKRAFRRLDEATRNAILDAANKAEKRGWKASMEETDAKIEMLNKNGVAIVQPGEQLQNDLKSIGKTMVEEWLEKAGKDGKEVLDAYNG
ncbi:MAG: TRAP transporter substrate-binding protein [Hyphomicrobiaceae bacterium]